MLKDSAEISGKRFALEQIASSPSFRRSARLRELLLYIGEKTLDGHIEELSEQVIGTRVFGRQEGYNPGEDNIVRASVRQLRLKLREFYQSDHGLQWIVEIPKGGYTAVFSRPHTPFDTGKDRSSFSFRFYPLLFAALFVFMFVGAVLLGRRFQTHSMNRAEGLINSLFDQNPGPIHFVLTDSALVIMNLMRGSPVTVDEYVHQPFAKSWEPNVQDSKEQKLWEILERRQITSLADVTVLSEIYRQFPSAAGRIEVVHAKHMQLRDLKSGNFILTGSWRSNPWAGIFEPTMNFPFDYAVGIRNLAPRQGEPAVFEAKRAAHLNFGRIALLKNLSGNGFVLLIAGIDMEATEGAGEFLLKPEASSLIRKALGLRPGEPYPSFEMVLEISTLEGTARSARIVACRRH